MLKFIRIILSPLTFLYRFVINKRNKLFDSGTFKEEQVDAKVISVGNLTVGGSGKTPTVIYLTKLLKNKNIKVGVLSRGYGRNTKGYQLVSKHDDPILDVKDSRDEIYLVATECNVPTAVSEKRVIGAKKFLTDVELDVIILDDAFQHRWIARDLNILIVEQKFLSSVNSTEQNLLPLGSMREPFDSIERADVVLINRKFARQINIPTKLTKYFSNKNIYYSKYKVDGIVDFKNGKTYSLEEFKDQQSLVVCGIARPFSFLRSLQDNNINIKNQLVFSDHKDYTIKEIEKIRKEFYETNSYSVLTTQKDAVKLSQFLKELDDIDIFYLKISLEIENEIEFLKILDEKILIH